MTELEEAESAILEYLHDGKPRGGARSRILAYFLQRGVGEAVTAEELRRVSGIQEWARRIRELRVEEGWDIRVDGSLYRLCSVEPNLEVAKAWKIANTIRRNKSLSAQDRVLEYCKMNVGRTITDVSLQYVSGLAQPSQQVRSLRTQLGYAISTEIERPELEKGEFVLESKDPILDSAVRRVSDSVRRRVFERDDYRCAICHRRGGHGVVLTAHRLVAKAAGGSDVSIDNFVTLCLEHHESALENGENVLRLRRRLHEPR